MKNNINKPVVDIDANGNIHFKSNGIDIRGGPGAAADFHEAMKKEVDNFIGYGLHPVTGKPMSENDFYTLAKQQNWTDEEIANNLYNK